MADNISIKDGGGIAVTMATKDIGGVQHGKSIPVDSTGTEIFGSTTDAKSTATNATAASAMSVWKQISASVQLMIFGAGTAAAAQRVTLASDDPAVAVLGAKADAKSTATDTTAISVMSVLKQISASVQAALSGFSVSTYQLLSAAASTNGTSVKASSGSIYALTLFNASASNKYLKLYNKASAPTVGTDTPVLTFLVPPGGTFFLDRPAGIFFSLGIAFAITGAAAVADATALAAGDILCLNVEYA